MAAWSLPDWRDEGVYAPVIAGGRPALAWELLRRDPAYQFFASRVGPDGIAPRWGLHFRS